MTACCTEPGCRRKQPIRFALGDFSGRVLAATRMATYRRAGCEHVAMAEKHDVTDSMRQFIRANPEWVRGVLAESVTT